MTYTLHHGSCLEVMKTLADNSVDAIVTDPPYELGFMGKGWDKSGIANNVEVWKEALRVLKPGGHLLAFSGSRTYHRMTCAIEDAGFEVRDQIMWVYGSGFPKSLDVSKAIDKALGAVREVTGVTHRPEGRAFAEGGSGFAKGKTLLHDRPASASASAWQGWGTALKPAHEPICVARKPLIGTVAANVLEHGTGGLNIDGCRIDGGDGEALAKNWQRETITDMRGGNYGNGLAGAIALATKAPSGRWPANFIHDGLEQEWARFFYCPKASKRDRDEGLDAFPLSPWATMGNGIGGQPDQQMANNKNTHPTVKPTDLMAYLVRLVTPPGGIVLDPFMGSGSTGKACMREGFSFIGIDLQAEYIAIAKARIDAELATPGPTTAPKLEQYALF